jgi:hypothetical protein
MVATLFQLPLLFLFAGLTTVAVLSAFLVRNWFKVPEARRGPRFGQFRRLNLVVIGFACLAAMALVTRDYFSGRVSFVGLPIVILLFLSAGSPRRFENR